MTNTTRLAVRWTVKQGALGYVATSRIGQTQAWPTRRSALAAAALLEGAHAREAHRKAREAAAAQSRGGAARQTR